jgi:hypothetical protein
MRKNKNLKHNDSVIWKNVMNWRIDWKRRTWAKREILRRRWVF